MNIRFIQLPKFSPKTTKYCIKTKNQEERAICEKIKKISFFSCFFSPVLSFSQVNGAISQAYWLAEQEELQPFFPFFSLFKENHFHIVLLDSFRHLEKAVNILNKNELSTINGWKIGFNHQNQPLLHDLERNEENHALTTIEYHCIDFLERNKNIESLSKENVEFICRQSFSRTLENPTLRETFLFSWINQPKSHILQHMYSYSKRWNVYKLCVLYLEVVSKYKQMDSLHLCEFIQELRENCPVLPAT